MKPASFEYQRAASVAEALSAMRDPALAAKPIAGGQSLGPMLNLRLARPPRLVDISGVEELRHIKDCGAFVRFGAAVTHARIEDEAGAYAGVAPLARVARGIAYRAVRNRGTIGGSLAHADPAADWMTALMASRPSFFCAGRRNPASLRGRIHAGRLHHRSGADEIIESVRVPKLSADARWGYYKVWRKTGEFAHALAAVVVDPTRRPRASSWAPPTARRSCWTAKPRASIPPARSPPPRPVSTITRSRFTPPPCAGPSRGCIRHDPGRLHLERPGRRGGRRAAHASGRFHPRAASVHRHALPANKRPAQHLEIYGQIARSVTSPLLRGAEYAPSRFENDP